MGEPDRALITCKLIFDALADFDDLFANHDVEYDVADVPGQQLSEAELVSTVAPYAGILAGDDEITATVIAAAPELRVISKWGIGVDAIDLDAARRRGVVVYNTPGVFGEELADYALGFLLLLARRQHQVDRAVRRGVWHKVRGESLAGKTLGIVGLGSSGRALARRAAAMGLEVLGHDPVEPGTGFLAETGCAMVPFEELLSRSDVVSLHLPAGPETRHLIDEEALRSMRRGTWLINVSRGTLVDEDALCRALDDGRLGAAALDVFAREPLDPASPLLRYDNVVVGSHNGSNTRQAVERTNRLAIENLLRGLGREVD